jgi:hypothetical protein
MRQRTTLAQLTANLVPSGFAAWLAIAAPGLPPLTSGQASAATMECELSATRLGPDGASLTSWSLVVEYTGGDELQLAMPSGIWSIPVVHEAFPYVVGMSQSGIVTRLYAIDFQAHTLGIVGVSAPIRMPEGSELPSTELRTFEERVGCR